MTNHKRRGGDLQRIQTSQRRGGGAVPRTLLPRFKRRVAQLNAPLWSNLRWLQLRCHHLSKLIQWSCRQGLSQWLTQGFCQTYQPVLPLLGEPSLDLKISNSNGNVGDWCSTRMSPKRCGKIMLSVSSGPCVLLLGTMMLAWRNSLRKEVMHLLLQPRHPRPVQSRRQRPWSRSLPRRFLVVDVDVGGVVWKTNGLVSRYQWPTLGFSSI